MKKYHFTGKCSSLFLKWGVPQKSYCSFSFEFFCWWDLNFNKKVTRPAGVLVLCIEGDEKVSYMEVEFENGGGWPPELVADSNSIFLQFFLFLLDRNFRSWSKSNFWVQRKILQRQTWSGKNSGHKSYKSHKSKFFGSFSLSI